MSHYFGNNFFNETKGKSESTEVLINICELLIKKDNHKIPLTLIRSVFH